MEISGTNQISFRKSAYEYGGKIILSILLIVVIVGIPMLIYWVARARRERWVFEEDKYTYHYGVFEKHTEETTFSKVISVKVDQNIFQRLFNVGDIEISLIGGLGFSATNIKDPKQVKEYFEEKLVAGKDVIQGLVN